MKVYPVKKDDDNDLILAFEIDEFCITKRAIIAILQSVEGVGHLQKRPLFSSDAEVHVRFVYKEVECFVWEPYGDNSRLWIGPAKADNKISMNDVARAFSAYKPPVIIEILGAITSVQPLGLLARIRKLRNRR